MSQPWLTDNPDRNRIWYQSTVFKVCPFTGTNRKSDCHPITFRFTFNIHPFLLNYEYKSVYITFKAKPLNRSKYNAEILRMSSKLSNWNKNAEIFADEFSFILTETCAAGGIPIVISTQPELRLTQSMKRSRAKFGFNT